MNNVVEIFEIEKICVTLHYNIYVAFNNFFKYYDFKKNFDPKPNLDLQQQYSNWKKDFVKNSNSYLELQDQIVKRIGKNLFEENNIEIIYLSDELDENLLDIVINLIRKEIYGTSLKIFFNKDKRTIYMWYEGIINNKPYYIEEEKEIKVLKSLNYKSKYYNKI